MIFAVGIEDTFVAHAREGERPLDEYELTQHYKNWEQDLISAKEIGASMIRYGIPWHKVEPQRGQYDWEFTDKVMNWFSENQEIQPIIDFIHYGLPLWIEDSFNNDNYPAYICEFVEKFTNRYKYHYFTATNEPFVSLHYSCVRAEWPPYSSDSKTYYNVLKNIAIGMVKISQTIKTIDSNKINIHVDACTLYDLEDEKNDENVKYWQEKSYIFWDILNCKLQGELLLEIKMNLGEEFIRWFEENEYLYDYSGINFYPQMSYLTRINGNDVPKIGGSEQLIEVCDLVHKKYGRPLFITETSYIGDVEDKIKWITNLVELIENKKINVVGFTYFPFIDLVDWAYKYSNKTIEEEIIKFGLFDLISKNGELVRSKNDAADHFAKLANGAEKVRLEIYK